MVVRLLIALVGTFVCKVEVVRKYKRHTCGNAKAKVVLRVVCAVVMLYETMVGRSHQELKREWGLSGGTNSCCVG